MTGKPNAFCLRHDPSIPQAWREKFQIPFEVPPKDKPIVKAKAQNEWEEFLKG